MRPSRSAAPGLFYRLLNVAAVCSAALFLAACGQQPAPVSAAHPVVLRYASPYGPTHPFSRGDAVWIRYVEAQSQGKLRIEPYWGGSLMDESDSVRELAAGVADVSFVLPIYLRAGAHFIRGQTPFYDGATDMHLQNRVLQTLWAEFPQLSDELASVKPLIITGGSALEVLTRDKPIRTLADLKGLRLRSPAEITTVLDELGVEAEFMPMGEVYTALSKGTIDGVIAPVDTLKAMRFAEVVKHCTLVNIARGAYYSRAMNLQSWARLSPELQQVIERSLPIWSEAMIKELISAHDSGLQLAHERGVQFIELAPADQQRFRDIYARMATAKADELEAQGLPGHAAYARAQEIIRGWLAAKTL